MSKMSWFSIHCVEKPEKFVHEKKDAFGKDVQIFEDDRGVVFVRASLTIEAVQEIAGKETVIGIANEKNREEGLKYEGGKDEKLPEKVNGSDDPVWGGSHND